VSKSPGYQPVQRHDKVSASNLCVRAGRSLLGISARANALRTSESHDEETQNR
jgi:hypothetical protein